MDNPEKLSAQVTQDEEKQSKNTTQYVLDTTMHKQTKITEINVREYRRGIKNANREKLARYGTQDEENLSTNTAHYVLDTTLRKQTK